MSKNGEYNLFYVCCTTCLPYFVECNYSETSIRGHQFDQEKCLLNNKGDNYKDYMSVLPAGTKEKCPGNRGDSQKDYMSVLPAGTKEKCSVNRDVPFIEIIITKI